MQHDQSVNEPNAKGKQAVTNNGATTSIGASARVGTGTGVGAGIGAGVVKTTATATGTTGNAPITNASISSPSTSSYSSWTVPSLDNLARRAINARYGLMGSRSATLVPSKISPTPSGMSVMMEGGAHGISIQNKARKTWTNNLSQLNGISPTRGPPPDDKDNQLREKRKKLFRYSFNIPGVIVNFVKKSLSWLGITQNEEDPELQKELHTTNGDFEFLPGADKDGETSTVGSGSSNNYAVSSSAKNERLYPDLREYITTLKSTANDHSINQFGKRQENEVEDAIMAPERQAHRNKLRKGLESMEPTDYDSTNTAEMSTPLVVESKDQDIDLDKPDKGQEPLVSSLKLNQRGQDVENIEGLTHEELVLLGRIRQLTETPLERARRNVRTSLENRSKEEKIAREFVTPYSLIRLAREEPEPAPRQPLKPLDTILPYNKDYRRRRPSGSARDDTNDHVMDSGDSEFDADESDHAKYNTLLRARQNRRREKPADTTQSSPNRTRRTSRPEVHEDQRTSRGGLQYRSNVTPKRHVKSIAGRFSALDTDEEEEDLQNEIVRRAQRAAQHAQNAAQRALDIASNWAGSSSHTSSLGDTTKSGLPGGRPQPQLYPSLQFGSGRKLYNPKLDEVLAWTSSPHDPSSSSKPASSKESTSPSIISEVISAAPAVIGALATAAGATGIAKLATDFAEKDSHKPPSMPSLFTPSFGSAPALTDKNSEGEKAKVENEKIVGTAKESEKEAEKKPAPAFSWGMADNGDKWKCPTCDVRNNNDLNKCPCCETAKPGGLSTKPTEQKTPAMPSLFTPSFGSTSSTPTPASKIGSQPTPPLFTFGAVKPSEATTPSISAPAPVSAATTFSSTPAAPATAAFGWRAADNSNKWKCPTCDVYNKNDLNKCPCCETAKPGGSTGASVSAAPVAPATPVTPATPAFSWGATDNTNKWKCPTCDVYNKNDLNKCPCCETAKPGGSTGASATAPAVPSLFAFKPPTSTGTSTPAPSSKGTDAGAATVPAFKPFAPPSNMFGAPPSTTPSSEAKPPTFSFGAPSSTTAAETSSEASKPLFANPFAAKAPSISEGVSKPTQPIFTFGTPSTSAAPTSTPLFGNTSAAPTSTPLFGNISAATTPSIPAFGPSTSTLASSTSASVSGPSASITTTSTPLFGGSTTASTPKPLFGTAAPVPGSSAGSAPSLFGTNSTNSAVSTAVASAPLFSLSTPSTSTVTSTATTSAAPPSLFGSIANTTTTPSATPAPFSFSSSSTPTLQFGQSTSAASTSGVTTATTPSTPSFTFGSGPTSTPLAATGGAATATPAFGGFGGFGAPATSKPFSLTTSTPATTTPSTGFAFGGSTANATSQPANSTSFPFGSSTPNTGTGFGSTASTTAPTFTFGNPAANASSSGGSSGFGGFGSTQSTQSANNNSMLSPTIPNATPATSSGTTGFGGFGSTTTSGAGFGGGFSAGSGGFGAAASTPNPFGSSTTSTTPSFGATTSTPSFGAAASTPSTGFGASASQANPFPQTGGFGSSSMGGFGSSSTGFGGGNNISGGFGSSNSSGGMISLAGPGAPGTGFGFGGAGAQQPGQAFGGFGAGGNNDGKFGFQNISNAPGGAQYAPQPSLQQPAGGFSFNLGAGPAPGEAPANRKIAKMRKKRN
ncbi:hypothetical protein BGZ46_005629 [Entomortierella lignicola]|nr:hypothetical protein BGZ46_005629 [Entomortierella lignicola]